MELSFAAVIVWVLYGCNCPYSLLCYVSLSMYIVRGVGTGQFGLAMA